jgi:hypothetical protein
MSFEITGKLIAKFDTIQRTGTFKTREFVIEKTEATSERSFTNYIKLQCVQDKTSMLDRFNIGDEVKIYFNIKGSKWSRDGKDNYITNLDAWKMEHTNASNNVYNKPVSSNVDPATPDAVDDLPF